MAKPSTVILLCCVLLTILLVQVLPQVDLLDIFFQCGTAPIVVHARATGSLVLQEFSASPDLTSSGSNNALPGILAEFLPKLSRNFPVLHHAFRC